MTSDSSLATVCLLALAACAAPRAVAARGLDRELLGSLCGINGESSNVAAALDSGQPVAFVFWQPWCNACRLEAPKVVDAQRELGDRVRIFGVVSGPSESVDDDRVRATMFELGMDYPQIRDRSAALAQACAVSQTPTIVVVDPGLRVRYNGHHLPRDWNAVLDRSVPHERQH